MNASAHINDDSPLVDFISRRSKKFAGKVSAYVRDLIERDAAGDLNSPPGDSATVLVELCTRLRPERTMRLVANLDKSGLDQPALLGRILEALDEDLALRVADGDNLHPLPIVLLALLPKTLESVTLQYRFSNDVKSKKIGEILDHLNQTNTTPEGGDLLAAEDPSPFSPTPAIQVIENVKKHANRAPHKSTPTPPTLKQADQP